MRYLATALLLLLFLSGCGLLPGTQPSPTPSPTATAEPTATATPSSAKPTPTPSPIPTLALTPTPVPSLYIVGNTGGDGVYLRRTPKMSDKIVAYPDDTPMQGLGEETKTEEGRWIKVRTPDKREGWVPAQYLIEVTPTPAARASPTSEVTATVVSTGTPPSPLPTATPAPTASPTPKAACPPENVIVAEIADLCIGQIRVVEFWVEKAVSSEQGDIFLQSRSTAKGQFAAFIPALYRDRFGADPAKSYVGKAVRVTGEILLAGSNPMITLADPSQIEVIGE